MSIVQADAEAADTLRIEGELTIYRAAELKPLLLGAVRADGVPALDLSAVTEFDSAGLQLVLMMRRAAAVHGRTVRIVDPSPAVREVLALIGLTELAAGSAGAAA
ncbi:anti-anti-sigma factor [Pseudoduganella lurida]|uniref:Anti-anti-sigma factor n=1 Tax=Pseudoduganella lurida TaxID=1036180 RepID=A0A562R149_9BURK|nr:STAS domain-containing protein [Pseudoduganella lurida]TWI62106.1 anti-anti-sigma factor [Pseudoduganella lurida]